MDPNEVPTKGNLMRARNSLKLARQGYDLMDKKRNILIRELTAYTEEAREIQEVINETYRKAYASLQKANMQMGIENVQTIAETLPVDMSIEVKTRSVMGTEIPLVRYDAEQNLRPAYAFFRTRDSLDRQGSDREACPGGDGGLPARGKYPEDAEAGQRSEEYHHSSL